MAVENFTTYTEYDDNNRYTVDATSVERILYQSSSAYVVKDFGADNFTTYTHTFVFDVISRYGTTYGTAIFYSVSDSSTPRPGDLGTDNIGVALWTSYAGGTSFKVQLTNYNGDASDSTTEAAIMDDASTSYVKVVKTSTTVTAYFYSDSGMETLIDSIAVNCTDDFRYLAAAGEDSTGGYVNWKVSNLDLGSAVATIKRRLLMGIGV